VIEFALAGSRREKLLATVFGDRYLDYKTRTRMIIPYFLAISICRDRATAATVVRNKSIRRDFDVN
jgi:hypothetical protein